MADCKRPLVEWERNEAERLGPEIAEAESRRRIAEAALKRAESDAASAGTEDRAGKRDEAARLARELEAVSVPARPRLLADDCSPERLASLLHEQGGRMAVLSAEGDLFDLMAGRYSTNGGPNFGVFLRAHAGDELRVDRVGRGAEYVPSPALTLGLAVQPDVIQGLADRQGFRGRGLLGRFLYSLPQSTMGRRRIDAGPVPGYVASTWHRNVTSMLEISMGTDDAGRPAPHTLILNADARSHLVDFAAWIEPQLGEFGELGGIWGASVIGPESSWGRWHDSQVSCTWRVWPVQPHPGVCLSAWARWRVQ